MALSRFFCSSIACNNSLDASLFLPISLLKIHDVPILIDILLYIYMSIYSWV